MRVNLYRVNGVMSIYQNIEMKDLLNTVILLWTLYYTKHRNWFLVSVWGKDESPPTFATFLADN